MRDGLPKLKDFPAELGGSGEMVPSREEGICRHAAQRTVTPLFVCR